MTSSDSTTSEVTVPAPFDDPVGYLASFGIDSELISDTSLPRAA